MTPVESPATLKIVHGEPASGEHPDRSRAL
jgi:hypothetical protein